MECRVSDAAEQLVLPALPTPPRLRKYQNRVVDECLAYLSRGCDPLLEMPTGAGKAVVLAAVSRHMADAGYETWLFAHRRELIRQLSGHCAAVGLAHGIISPEFRMTDDLVQIASVDTVRARIDVLRRRMRRIGLIIVDECHHSSSDSYRLVLSAAPNARRMGCTATAYRLDGKPLGDLFNEEVRGPSAFALEKAGYLSPVRVIAPPSAVDLSGVTKRGGDFVTSQSEKIVNTDEVTHAAIQAYAQHLAGLPTIAYCTTVQHAEDVAHAFTTLAGWSVEVIEGKMSKPARDEAIAGLAAGRHQILFSIDCISEGVDVPVVAGGLMLRPTDSTGLFVQQCGRLRRIYPGKTEAVLLDLVGNWSRHGMPNAVRPWSLKEGVKGQERAVKAARRCRNCHHVIERGPERCPICNRKYPLVVQRPGAPDEAQLMMMAPVGGISALRISVMPLGEVLKIARGAADLEQVRIIHGYDKRWVAHVLNRSPQYRRFG